MFEPAYICFTWVSRVKNTRQINTFSVRPERLAALWTLALVGQNLGFRVTVLSSVREQWGTSCYSRMWELVVTCPWDAGVGLSLHRRAMSDNRWRRKNVPAPERAQLSRVRSHGGWRHTEEGEAIRNALHASKCIQQGWELLENKSPGLGYTVPHWRKAEHQSRNTERHLIKDQAVRRAHEVRSVQSSCPKWHA